MNPAGSVLLERDARLAGHCREGFRRTCEESAYRTAVLERLRPELDGAPDDLWAAIPWTWAVLLGGERPRGGVLTGAVVEAAAVLREWLGGDESIETLRARWSATGAAPLALGSTLRSHPFPDLRAWSIRPRFAVSSSTPHDL